MARVWIADVPILAWLIIRNMVAKPSIRFSNSGSSASGVTSRPVKPVPPVVMIASTPGSAIQALTCARILSTSSVTIAAPRACGRHLDPFSQHRAGLVVRHLARVGNGQDGDVERDEISGLVDTGHFAGLVPDAAQRVSDATQIREHVGECGSRIPQRIIACCATPGRELRDSAARNVSQAETLPLSKPILNQRWRCSGRTMGKRIRHHPAAGLTLQAVVADGGCDRQRALDVTGLEEVHLALRMIGPDAAKAIGLQFDAHLDVVRLRLAAGGLLHLLGPRQDAEQILHVMPHFMRDHVGLCELALLAGAGAELLLHVAEEGGVEEHAPVGRAIERPHRRLGHAALAGAGRTGEQAQTRHAIGLAVGSEDFGPDVLGGTEHGSDKLAPGDRWARPSVSAVPAAPSAGRDRR